MGKSGFTNGKLNLESLCVLYRGKTYWGQWNNYFDIATWVQKLPPQVGILMWLHIVISFLCSIFTLTRKSYFSLLYGGWTKRRESSNLKTLTCDIHKQKTYFFSCFPNNIVKQTENTVSSMSTVLALVGQFALQADRHRNTSELTCRSLLHLVKKVFKKWPISSMY